MTVCALAPCRLMFAFAPPANVIPRSANGRIDFNTTTPASGRQHTRGISGLALSPDGTYIYAIMRVSATAAVKQGLPFSDHSAHCAMSCVQPTSAAASQYQQPVNACLPLIFAAVQSFAGLSDPHTALSVVCNGMESCNIKATVPQTAPKCA